MIQEFSGQFVKLKNFCLEEGLIQEDSLIVLALSGGVDSVCLAYFLLWLQERGTFKNIRVVAAHLNHMIRPGAAETDQAFVTDLCGQLGLELRVRQVDVPALARERQMGLEEAGRFARYQFFNDLILDLTKHHAEKKDQTPDLEDGQRAIVLLGHHRDDLAESVVMNLGRGSGLSGLTTLKAKQGIYRRPLLILSKSEILQLAKDQGWTWCEDQTNESDDYLRNRIRHDLLPTWTDVVGYDVRPVLARLSCNLADAEEGLTWAGQEAYSHCLRGPGPANFSLKELRKLPAAVLKLVLDQALALSQRTDLADDLTLPIGMGKALTALQHRQIWQIIHGDHGNKLIDIGDGLAFRRSGRRLMLVPYQRKPRQLRY